MFRKIKILIILNLILLFFCLNSFNFYSIDVLADADDSLSGYIWSENIGWINFNCSDRLHYYIFPYIIVNY